MMRLRRLKVVMLGVVVMSASLPVGNALASDASVSTGSVPAGTVHSAQQLLQIRDSIETKQPLAGALGRSLTVWYSDPNTNVVVVGVTKVTEQITAAARATWGSAVRVVQRDRPVAAAKITRIDGSLRRVKIGSGALTADGVAPSAIAPFPSRLLDAQPYYGGTRIGLVTTVTGGFIVTECTAAFADSRGQMLTAGHCFPATKLVEQGYFDAATSTWNYTDTMGRTDWVQWGNNRTDAAELNPAPALAQPPAGNIYWNLQTSYVGKGNSYMTKTGLHFCADGSFTGENCNGVVDAVDICVNLANADKTTTHTCDLISGHSSNGSRLVQHGDSGGPVYVTVPGGVARSGIISAGIISAGNIGTGQPGNQIYFTDLKYVCTAFARC